MRRADIHCPRDPIGLSRAEAAAFIGVSPNTFDAMVQRHEMPAPRRVGARLLWHAGEVEQAFLALPRRAGAHQPVDSAADGLDSHWQDTAA